LKRRFDLGFHFSAFLRKRPTPTASYLCCPRWTIGGPANIAKLPEASGITSPTITPRIAVGEVTPLNPNSMIARELGRKKITPSSITCLGSL